MKTDSDHTRCPLCRTPGATVFHTDRKRPYLCCSNCSLIFVPPPFHIKPSDEKREYDRHENSMDTPGYRNFLSRLCRPLMNRLSPESHGLDFGCGPGRVLSAIMEEQGHRVDRFDPFYHNTPEAFEKTYDFISATEVVEHLRDPHKEFSRLFQILKQGGWMGIMTKLATDREAFKNWHYIRDDTHISFYSRLTFGYLAQTVGARLEFIGNDVILLKKR